MKLLVNKTGSAGNSYALFSDVGEMLLLEAGIQTRKMLRGVDYEVSKIKGCLISHAHL